MAVGAVEGEGEGGVDTIKIRERVGDVEGETEGLLDIANVGVTVDIVGVTVGDFEGKAEG